MGERRFGRIDDDREIGGGHGVLGAWCLVLGQNRWLKKQVLSA